MDELFTRMSLVVPAQWWSSAFYERSFGQCGAYLCKALQAITNLPYPILLSSFSHCSTHTYTSCQTTSIWKCSLDGSACYKPTCIHGSWPAASVCRKLSRSSGNLWPGKAHERLDQLCRRTYPAVHARSLAFCHIPSLIELPEEAVPA